MPGSNFAPFEEVKVPVSNSGILESMDDDDDDNVLNGYKNVKIYDCTTEHRLLSHTLLQLPVSRFSDTGVMRDQSEAHVQSRLVLSKP